MAKSAKIKTARFVILNHYTVCADTVINNARQNSLSRILMVLQPPMIFFQKIHSFDIFIMFFLSLTPSLTFPDVRQSTINRYSNCSLNPLVVVSLEKLSFPPWSIYKITWGVSTSPLICGRIEPHKHCAWLHLGEPEALQLPPIGWLSFCKSAHSEHYRRIIEVWIPSWYPGNPSMSSPTGCYERSRVVLIHIYNCIRSGQYVLCKPILLWQQL